MENPTLPQKSKPNFVVWITAGVTTLAIGVSIGLAVGKYSSSASSQIISYDDCVNAKGSIVQYSYPATCVTASGQRFAQPVSAPTATPTETTDPTANWKTYTNEDYGFSFSYPDELTYLYDHLKGGNILLQNFDGSSPRKELDSDFQMVITANDTNGKPLEDYPKRWETELGKLPTETISVGGITAIKGFSGQKYQAVPTVWFSKNATTFMIQLSHPKSTNKIWFDQILSTFKFTN